MKGILLLSLAIIVFSGCATKGRNSATLIQTYSKYEQSVNKENLNEIANDFFSQSLLGKGYLTNPDARNQLLFKNYMKSVDSFYESSEGLNGCLTINGYDEESAPLIFSLKYNLENETWLIDKIHIVFIENPSDFSERAKCPGDFFN